MAKILCHFYHRLGMVSKHTTYKKCGDWGILQMTLFYPHDWDMSGLTWFNFGLWSITTVFMGFLNQET
jgi:hypothetical protein